MTIRIPWTSIRLAQLARAKRQQLPKVKIELMVDGENTTVTHDTIFEKSEEREIRR